MTYLHTQKKRLKKYDCFYAVATNLEDSAKDILNITNPEDMCYMSTYTSLHLCAALNAITGLGLDENKHEKTPKYKLRVFWSFLFLLFSLYFFIRTNFPTFSVLKYIFFVFLLYLAFIIFPVFKFIT